jgi:hypothetical protein
VGFFFFRRCLTPHRIVYRDFGHLSSRSPHKKAAGVAVNAAQANPILAERKRPDAEDSAQAAAKGVPLHREF